MIPIELKNFFKERGHILVVKGKPGTGKTILGLKILDEMSSQGDVFWVNTRDVRIEDLPRFEQVVPESGRLDASPSAGRRERRFGTAGAETTEIGRPMKFRTDFEILQELNDEVLYADSPTVVIDSYDGLIANLPEEKKSVFGIQIGEMARSTKTNLCLIMETAEDNRMDYLGDGVVSCNYTIENGRRLRQIHLEKLRNVHIDQPSYVFSLYRGIYHSFAPFKPYPPTQKKLHRVLPNKYEFFSSGSKAMDSLLQGGYQRGSFVLLELSDTLSPIAESYFLTPTLANFVLQGSAAFIYPSGGLNLKLFTDTLVPYIGKEDFDDRVRLWVRSGVEENYTINYEGRNFGKDYELWFNSLIDIKKKTEDKPTLHIIGYDTMETCYGPIVKDLAEQVEFAKDIGDLIIGLTKPGLQSTQSLRNMADMHLKLGEQDGSILLMGEKPKTETQVVEINMDKGSPDVVLRPVV